MKRLANRTRFSFWEAAASYVITVFVIAAFLAVYMAVAGFPAAP